MIGILINGITASSCEYESDKFRSESMEELLDQRNGSLRYAKLLQEALFHDPEALKEIFPESFLYYSPRDILGGDFYWFEKVGNKAIVACADCTGHGVPGAMLSVLGVNKLHETIKMLEISSPDQILNRLNNGIYKALGKKRDKKMNDGMDIALYSVDLDTKMLEYAGANNPLYIIREKKLFEIKADKQGIGTSDDPDLYTNCVFQLNKGDMIYSFTDGYFDQFGGEKGKKFMTKQFKELLISLSDKDMTVQKEGLDQTIKDWMGEYDQVDDMCIIGVRV
jgi:serine phosphatase RsbU (regulator of sigma subunit)